MTEAISSKVIICDIEGTTTSIQFVKDTLFPYSLKHVKDFITTTWGSAETQEAVKSLIQQARLDAKNNIGGIILISEQETNKEKIIDTIVNNFHIQVKNDLKVGPLKALQGLIWEQGFKSGAIKGHAYNDVPKGFTNWTKKGLKIYIYSSGSVQAQKLLYTHSEHGNLLPLISGHFDTKIGMKQETKSYENIAKEIEYKSEDILFFTDIPKEAYAAKAAGMTAILLERPGNAEICSEDRKAFVVIRTFDEINVILK